jgi:putative addiction module killer protein
METRPRNVIVYQDRQGQEPLTRWFDRLRDHEAAARIARRLDRLRSGNPGDSKAVGEGVEELRIDYGPGYRVYFGQDGDAIVVLLVGGDKRTQSRDIETARTCWKDYKERKQ